MAAAPGPGPGLHPGRVPRLGARRVPGRPRPPRPHPRGKPSGPGEEGGPAEGDQDRPVPFFGRPNGTAHLPPSPLIASPPSAPPWPPGRPEHRRRPRRPAQGRPRRPERRPPMILKYAIALAILIILAAMFAWAFLPARYLPGNRARHLRIRLHLRLHPGKGFAHAFSLWLRWGRLAALRRSSRIRPAPPAVVPDRRTPPALSLPRPGPLPAPPPRPAGRAPARHGPAPHLQDRVPRRRHLELPRPGHRHQHQTRPVRPDQPRARPARPGARVQPAAHRRRPLHLLLVPGRRLPGPGHRHPPRRRVRVRRLGQGRRGRHVLVRQSQRLPARLLPRRRPGPVRPAHGRRLGIRRRPGRPRADPARRRRPPVGAHPGRTAVRGPQDRRHRPDGHVPGPGVHGRPRPGRLASCRHPAAGSTSPPSSPTAAPST